MIRFKLFVMSALMMLLVVGTAMAQAGGTAPAAGGGLDLKKLEPLAVGIAALGGALGDGRAIAGALPHWGMVSVYRARGNYQRTAPLRSSPVNNLNGRHWQVAANVRFIRRSYFV